MQQRTEGTISPGREISDAQTEAQNRGQEGGRNQAFRTLTKSVSWLLLSGLLAGATALLWSLPVAAAGAGVFFLALYVLTIGASGFLIGSQAPPRFTLLCAGLAGAHLARHGIEYALLLGVERLSLVWLTLPIGVLLLTGWLTTQGAARIEAIIEEAEERHEEIHAAHHQLGAQHEAVTAEAEKLAEMNTRLRAVQAELEAQYRALEIANAQYAALATTDGMTGLANHRAFQEELSRQLARVERSRAPLSLLLMDVDKFKMYNDSFGHPAGDVVLKKVAEILRTMVREGDFPARYGGEEFAVILPDTPADVAVQVAERVRAAVETEAFAHREVTVSIGVAQRLRDEQGGHIIERADVALYESKAVGRNCVTLLPIPAGAAGESVEETEETDSAAEPFVPALLSLDTLVLETGVLETGPSFPCESEDLTPIYQALDGGLEGVLQEPVNKVLSALLGVLDRRGAEPYGHTERVLRYTLRLANAVDALFARERETRPLLPHFTPGDITDLAFGALLHDIGKVGIPDAVLRKEGRLSDDEWRQIRRHPLSGTELLAGIPMLARALPVVRYHHERWDGTGYPQGLTGDAIPLAARIFAVCDTLDTLTTDRFYRTRLDFAGAREEILRGAGNQFDPDVVRAFLQIEVREWERLGLLSAADSHRLALPSAA